MPPHTRKEMIDAGSKSASIGCVRRAHDTTIALTGVGFIGSSSFIAMRSPRCAGPGDDAMGSWGASRFLIR
eukprot:3544018-Pleurochrysis_carterae.AAC.1